MPVEFSLTRDEYFAGQLLHSRRRIRRIWWIWLLLFMAMTLWFQRGRIGDPGFAWIIAGLFVAGLLLVALLVYAIPLILAWIMMLTVWRRQPGLREPVSFQVEDSGIRYASDRGNWQYRWTDLIARAENDRICLLYLAPNMMLFIPRRVLTPADMAIIRHKLKA